MNGFFRESHGFGFAFMGKRHYKAVVWQRHRIRIKCHRRVFIGRIRIDY